jgi:hypothetical protein
MSQISNQSKEQSTLKAFKITSFESTQNATYKTIEIIWTDFSKE